MVVYSCNIVEIYVYDFVIYWLCNYRSEPADDSVSLSAVEVSDGNIAGCSKAMEFQSMNDIVLTRYEVPEWAKVLPTRPSLTTEKKFSVEIPTTFLAAIKAVKNETMSDYHVILNASEYEGLHQFLLSPPNLSDNLGLFRIDRFRCEEVKLRWKVQAHAVATIFMLGLQFMGSFQPEADDYAAALRQIGPVLQLQLDNFVEFIHKTRFGLTPLQWPLRLRKEVSELPLVKDKFWPIDNELRKKIETVRWSAARTSARQPQSRPRPVNTFRQIRRGRVFKKYRPSNSKFQVRVRECVRAWDRVGNEFCTKVVKFGIDLSFGVRKSEVYKCFTVERHEYKLSQRDERDLDEILMSYLDEGIISEVCPPRAIFPNNIFVVREDHRSTKVRPILDMSKLNKYLRLTKFSLLKLKDVLPLINGSEFAGAVDISKAYHHLPVADRAKDFLSFWFRGKQYQFDAMPFGLSTAPYLFTCFLLPVINHLRVVHDMKIVSYLDDILILGDTYEETELAIGKAVRLMTELGFQVNLEKSTLTPVRQFMFLGVQFDLAAKTMANSCRLIEKARECVSSMIESRYTCRRALERVIGLLNFMAPYIASHRNQLHKVIYFTNKNFSIFHRDTCQKTSQELKCLLAYWLGDDVFQPVPIVHLNARVSVYVDASATGWGAAVVREDGHSYQLREEWGQSMCESSSNRRELAAIVAALRSAPDWVAECGVAVFSDNMAAVQSLNKLGSSQSLDRNVLVWDVCREAHRRRVGLQFHHVPGRENALADLLSRNRSIIPVELTISAESFDELCRATGMSPQTDLFATRLTRRVMGFVSPYPCVEALATNSLVTQWAGLPGPLYAFPPPKLILKTVHKWLVEDRPPMVLVTPAWYNQMWYPVVKQHRRSFWVMKEVRFQLPAEMGGMQDAESEISQLVVHVL